MPRAGISSIHDCSHPPKMYPRYFDSNLNLRPLATSIAAFTTFQPMHDMKPATTFAGM